ncbi:MAG: signal peptidase I [Methanoregula sp.]|nr:signal peptidase I [Methanoregula sp.]
MADKEKTRDIRMLINQFRTSEHWAVSLARDLLLVVAVVGSIALALFLICGTWPAVVTIESGSMIPHMNIGDLVVVVQKDRYGAFETWADGNATTPQKFQEYGDVIIYKPNGMTTVNPIIHRAIQYVDISPVTEIKGETLNGNYTPLHPGYITWGDNNPVPDQLSRYPGIGAIEPVKEEWIVGKALFTVPVVGYLPLNIIPVVIIVIIILVLYELYLRRNEREMPTKSPKRRGKNQR